MTAGLIERQANGDICPAIVPDDREAFVAEHPHQRDQVAGHRALRVRLVIGGGRRLARLAVATQAGADHGVVVHQERGDAVPGGASISPSSSALIGRPSNSKPPWRG